MVGKRRTHSALLLGSVGSGLLEAARWPMVPVLPPALDAARAASRPMRTCGAAAGDQPGDDRPAACRRRPRIAGGAGTTYKRAGLQLGGASVGSGADLRRLGRSGEPSASSRSTSWRIPASARRAPSCESLVLTDIATGWTECAPVVMRAGALVSEALQAAQGLFPFPLRGVDFDNDGAFMNEPVVARVAGPRGSM